MKNLCAIAALGIVVVSAAPANAQIVLDMSLVTCEQFLKSPLERQVMLTSWMSGYFSASQNRPQVDLRYLKRNGDVVAKTCRSASKETLMSVIKRTAR